MIQSMCFSGGGVVAPVSFPSFSALCSSFDTARYRRLYEDHLQQWLGCMRFRSLMLAPSLKSMAQTPNRHISSQTRRWDLCCMWGTTLSAQAP